MSVLCDAARAVHHTIQICATQFVVSKAGPQTIAAQFASIEPSSPVALHCGGRWRTGLSRTSEFL